MGNMKPLAPFPDIRRRILLSTLALLPALSVPLLTVPALAQTDPLPSWNEGATKQAITEFVARVTRQGSPDFVAPAERVATFDNDGTLWVEHPMYAHWPSYSIA
jgi:hypothetical protein